MNYLKNNLVVKFFRSTDIKQTLIKMIIFFVFVGSSFLLYLGDVSSLILFLLSIMFTLLEFSYSSVLWFLTFILIHPYVSYEYVNYAMIFFGVFFLVKFIIDIIRKKTDVKSWQTITLMVFFGAVLILLLLPIAPYYNIEMVFQDVMFFLILSILVINFRKINLKRIFLVFSIFIALVSITYNFFTYFDWCYEILFPQGDIFRFNLFIFDPNYTGGALLCALASILVLYKCQDINKSLFYVLFSVISICIFNTVSKAAFIVYVLLALYVFIDLLVKAIKQKTKKQTAEILIFSGVLLFSMLISYKAVYALLSRFLQVSQSPSDDNLSVLTTGRSDLWIMYLKEIFSSPLIALFGHGSFAPLLGADTHNALLSLLYYYGIVPVLILLAIYVVGIIKNRTKLIPFAIFASVCIFIMYMSLSILTNTCFYVFFFIFALFVYNKSNDSTIIEDKILLKNGNVLNNKTESATEN